MVDTNQDLEVREAKVTGYAAGWTGLNPKKILANVAPGFRLIEPGGNVVTAAELPAYLAELRKLGGQMDIRHIAVTPEVVWCEWQLGSVVGAGRIKATAEGVTEEKLYAA